MHIFILAGEPSGDEYGASLMHELLAVDSNIQFSGIGGPLMELQGLQSMQPLSKMSVMGFMEILKTLPFFMQLEKKIINHILDMKPDKIILIDYPGLNLRLCEKIKKQFETEIIYYISPQVWAWKESRVQIIKQYVDKLLVIFEFEKKWFHKKGVKAEYVGHPFLDVWNYDDTQIIKQYNLDLTKPILTLFPGSRIQEFKRHGKLLINSALKIKEHIPELQILLGLHPNIQYNKTIDSNIIIVQDMPLKALEIASAAIIASGTATLQAAIMNIPSVVIYKMNTVSWLLTKKMIKVPFASMANIIAEEEVFPEFLQNQANQDNIVQSVLNILNQEVYRKKMMHKIQIIKNNVGGPGASKKAAQQIMEV